MAAGGKGKTFIKFNNKYVFIDLFRICQGLWEFSRKFFAVGLRGKRGWGLSIAGGVDMQGDLRKKCANVGGWNLRNLLGPQTCETRGARVHQYII